MARRTADPNIGNADGIDGSAGDNGDNAFDPRADYGTVADGSPGNDSGDGAGSGAKSGSGRKRGRPAGGGGSSSKGKAAASPSVSKKDNAEFFAGLLSSMHMMAAAAFDAAPLALEPDEAKELADKIAEVQKHYPAAVFDPKYAAIGALVFAVVKIEGPRAMYLMNRKKKDSAE